MHKYYNDDFATQHDVLREIALHQSNQELIRDDNFAPPCKGGGVGMWQYFVPAPWGEVGMGLVI